MVTTHSRIPNPTTLLGWGRDSDLTSSIVTEATTISLLARLDEGTRKIVKIRAPAKIRSNLFLLIVLSDDCKDRGCTCSSIIPPFSRRALTLACQSSHYKCLLKPILLPRRRQPDRP